MPAQKPSRLVQLSGCKNGNCEKVFLDGDQVVIQGVVSATADQQLQPPVGEAVVVLSLAAFREAAAQVMP
jgi:hypothetical protein